MTKAEAIALFDGNMSALSRALGISRQAVHKWPKDKPVPEWWVDAIEQHRFGGLAAA
jgi:hypothetical protein